MRVSSLSEQGPCKAQGVGTLREFELDAALLQVLRRPRRRFFREACRSFRRARRPVTGCLAHVCTCLMTNRTCSKPVLKETAEKNDVPEAQTLAQAGLTPEVSIGYLRSRFS